MLFQRIGTTPEHLLVGAASSICHYGRSFIANKL
jgi:hypothetical protein